MSPAIALSAPMSDPRKAPAGESPSAEGVHVHVDSGHATFDQLLRVSGEIRDEIRDLGRTITREFHEWRQAHESEHRRQMEADAERFAALESAMRREELEDAVRQGRIAMALLALRWLTEHWELVAVILFGAWAIAGGLQVNIGEPMP